MNELSVLRAVTAAMVLSVFAAACGDDGGRPGDAATDTATDTGTGDGGGDGGTVDCSSSPDGTACGGNLICVGGDCQPSSCGDGFVDTGNAEACDDGNSVPGDGCEPESCQLSCTEDMNCDDGDPCNGAETCNSSLNRCQAGTPTPGTPCTQMDGSDGVCSGLLCAPPGCGNGAIDGTEECDDGANGDNDDGCRDDCTYTCDAESPCSDSDACNGDEECDLPTHTCNAGTAPDCNDSDPCTADSCDMEMGCVNTLVDGDGDGYAAPTCTTAGLMGGDCDDGDATAYPGAPEGCDSIDNDCNGMVDDGTVDITCQRDADGDGYGNSFDTMVACTCPSGYIPPHPSGTSDCDDTNPDVNPGVTTYRTTYYCPGGTSCTASTGSYDWNCSGVEERQYAARSTGSCTFDCSGRFCICRGSGWTTSTVPDCGDPRFFIIGGSNYRTCGPSGLLLCGETLTNRRQACR